MDFHYDNGVVMKEKTDSFIKRCKENQNAEEYKKVLNLVKRPKLGTVIKQLKTHIILKH